MKALHKVDGRRPGRKRGAEETMGKRWRWLALASAVVVLSATAAGCGDDEGSGGESGGASSGAAEAAVARAQASAEKWLAAPSEWGGPTEGPKPTPGKRVAIISCSQATEGCNRPTRSAEEAARLIGWEPTILDGKGEPSQQLAAANSAVDARFDAIIVILMDPVNLSEAMNKAKAADIPVVTLGAPGYSPERAAMDWIPDISHDWLATGDVLADYMIWKSNGDVNALLLHDSSTLVVDQGQFKGSERTLTDESKCPDCEVTVKSFTQATLTSQPAQDALATIQANPDINWVWCYDFCLQQAVQKLKSAGLGEDLLGAGFDCNAANLELMRTNTIQTVCVADPRDWEAWATIDQANRLVEGEPPADQKIPFLLVDRDTLDQLTPEDLEKGWQGGIDFRAEFKKIWGVQ
jgi:ribose transport system substrate-binding protein